MVVMKNIGFLLVFFLLIFSCADDANELASGSNSTESNLRTEFIQTTNQPDNVGLVPTLIADLKSQKFELKNEAIHPENSFYSWKEDIQFIIKGNGIKAYYFKRIEAEPKNYYPDFILTVFQFKSEDEAQSCFDKIEAAAKSGMHLRGSEGQKSPETIVRKGNEVFFLSTRAEMFRGYIEDCAKRIEGYSN